MKYVVYILLAAIVASLMSGLFYLRKDGGDSEKLLKALKVRVALSAVLVGFLVLGYFMGWFQA